MKFLNCLQCNDIVLMYLGGAHVCLCGRSQGTYIDRRQAEYSGPARVLGMLNGEYADSIHTDSTEKINYRWFVIPEGHNIRKVEKISRPISALKAAEPTDSAPTKTYKDVLKEAQKILEKKNKKNSNS